MESNKTIVVRIQYFLHNALWSKYFLPSVLFLVLIMSIVQIYLNITSDLNYPPTWRLWIIYFFSTIGTLSGLCGTYYINKRSIKWIYFQIVTIPSLVIAFIFSFLPLQALMWAAMIIPEIVMYRDWNKQVNPHSIQPKKLALKWIFCLFVLAIAVSIALGFTIQAMNNAWTKLPAKDESLDPGKFYIDIAPFIDSIILVFSFFGPLLVAKRYWAGNYFFIIANITSMLLFSSAIGTFSTLNLLLVIQSIIYLFYSLIGASSWITIYNEQHV